MSPDKKYLSLEEVADLLGVTYQLIYRLARAGDLPAVRIGRVYRVATSDLDIWLEQSKTSATTGGICSACGKSYSSSQSLKEKCQECDEPICVDCWTREGVRHCKAHSGS